MVRILDWGFEDGDKRYWISLEYIHGDTLENRLKKWAGGPDLHTALDIMIELIDGIAAAHAKDVIHRDLKPSNIMCDNSGIVKILDFGIAKIRSRIQEGMTVRGFGSRPYTSPEQLAGEEVDNRADIYSLGVIFLFILTGKAPYSDEEIVEQVKDSSISDDLKSILLKMTQ